MKSHITNKYSTLLITVAIFTASLLMAGYAAGEDRTYLVVTHKIKDFDFWKIGNSEAQSLKRQYGLKNSSVYFVNGNHNKIVVMEEYETLKGAKALASLPLLVEYMIDAGLIGSPEIQVYSATNTTVAPANIRTTLRIKQ